MRHKEKRKIAKKLRRKRIRQKNAKERERLQEIEEAQKLNDPKYHLWLNEQIRIEKIQQEQEDFQRQLGEKRWLERERLAQIQFQYEKDRKIQIEAAEKLQQEIRKKEIEELKKREKEKQEENAKLQKQILRKHQYFIKKLTDFVQGIGDLPKELTENKESNPGKELCLFFTKTAVCRHNHLCTKNHVRPGVSRVILLRNFFQHISLNEAKNNEYGDDILLEFTENELNKDYAEFFEDITNELEKFGTILNIRTAKNCVPHLKGNVYVEYVNEKSAMKAYLNLQGRFYASKQINVEFCSIISWKSAICGLSFSKSCLKGKLCNYIHILKNPEDKYNKPLNYGDISQIENRVDKRSSADTSWNDVDVTSDKRNWRWSESPDKEFLQNIEIPAKATAKIVSNKSHKVNSSVVRVLKTTNIKKKKSSRQRSKKKKSLSESSLESKKHKKRKHKKNKDKSRNKIP
ncbi:U2 small nuclear ribonucleoprotein auxiliary factor 35 kDa subunit-related protein 2 [Condylostylus longicornis]|uniref:U2 small nuclear ribonucleoprotein auxiliary factor 35 kDa subunit-related protein 2 n=1 Tax=Condylostylus longicornis TaxID=2530218 RepID=UPI00244DE965|nr:U2 small nuclear ribonucleoprotein auxiliary factor 35 kDa subunit-related protein 2 [Condylostylus longicornis]